jgi:HAD superfamily hydrolase (TIGR01509 family)
MAIRGVLFDWRGTLVRDPEDEWWLRTALHRLGRSAGQIEVEEMVVRLREAKERPRVVAAHIGADCSAERHRRAAMLLFAESGFDAALSDALYGLDLEPLAHPLYDDVFSTVSELRGLGVGVAVVSDIHFDLRPEFALNDLDNLIGHYVLSFEHGIEKPDPRIFLLAVDALGIQPNEALMVGDRPSRDGGALDAGITTLLLPVERGTRRGLDVVLGLVQASITSGQDQ